MRYVILGAEGQLGKALTNSLTGEVFALGRADADLTDRKSLYRAFESIQPTEVLNCAAYNLVDKAEAEPAAAMAINADAVRQLAQLCRSRNVRLVHFSTDYVFGGERERRRPYVEPDLPAPLSVYGQSKLAGEQAVLAASEENVVIRTCGLYGVPGQGGKGTNFVQTMLRLARLGKELKVVDDQRLTPSSAADVAIATAQLLKDCSPGLYHLTNQGDCTWFEFAKAIFAQAGLQVQLSPTTSAAYGSKAERPAYSVLRSERRGVPELRPWQEALAAYVAQLESRL